MLMIMTVSLVIRIYDDDDDTDEAADDDHNDAVNVTTSMRSLYPILFSL